VRYASDEPTGSAAAFLITAMLLLPALLAASACQREDDPRGTPPPSAWKPPPAESGAVGTGGAGKQSGEPSGTSEGSGDPHAGLDMGGAGDPHAGLDMGGAGDPHAGLDMGQSEAHSSPTGDQDPHANLDMGSGDTDPQMAAMEPPDPDRKIDESKFLRGNIRADAKVAGSVRAGAVLFLSAWPVDPNTGEVLGAPVAVGKLTVDKLPMAFELSERDAMAAGTRFEGDVIISARVDGDGEARTKEPGDVEGRLQARIPAKGLDLVLDTALR
jgi:hypothetical protein